MVEEQRVEMVDRIQNADFLWPWLAVTRTSVRWATPRVTTLVVYGFWSRVSYIQHGKRCRAGTYDWNKVVGNDSHVVAIDTETLEGLGSCIHQAEFIGLSRAEFELRNSGIVGALGLVPRSNS